MNLDIFHPKCVGVPPSLCNLYLQHFSFLYIQTLHKDCSYIEHVHLLFCAHFINTSYLMAVEVRYCFPSEMLRGYLVCVICNSSSFYSFIFKLCIMVHVQAIFCAHLIIYLRVLNLDRQTEKQTDRQTNTLI